MLLACLLAARLAPLAWFLKSSRACAIKWLPRLREIPSRIGGIKRLGPLGSQTPEPKLMSGHPLRGKLSIPHLPSNFVVVCEGQDCVDNGGWYKTCTGGTFYAAKEFKDTNWGWISKKACLFFSR